MSKLNLLYKAYIDGLCYIQDPRTGLMRMGCSYKLNKSTEVCGKPVRFPKEENGQIFYRCYKHPPKPRPKICMFSGCMRHPRGQEDYCKFHHPDKILKRRQQQHERDLPKFLKSLPDTSPPLLE